MQAETASNVRAHAETFGVDLGDGERPRLIDKKNTARVLGEITVREVENRIAAGDLEAVKLGRRRLVVVESLDAYVQRLRAEAAEPVPA